jgi:hypothetical protein
VSGLIRIASYQTIQTPDLIQPAIREFGLHFRSISEWFVQRFISLASTRPFKEPLMNAVKTPEPDVGLSPPKKGERFRCDQCGMEIEVTADCSCSEDQHVHFHCCDQEMTKVK